MPAKRKKPVSDSLASEKREGDGIDPREEKKSEQNRTRRGKPNYAVLRLAKQIGDTLTVSIGKSKDPILSSFVVNAVEPSPSGTSFVVQVFSSNPELEYEPREIKAILKDEKPRLRADVANTVKRKKAPDFTFDVLPMHVQPK